MHLYEVHIPVSDLERSIVFYRDVLGFELAFSQPQRHVAFMWVGEPGQSMIGLWGPNSAYGWKDGQRFKTHFAVSIPLDDLLTKPQELQALGIETSGFGDLTGDEPSVIGWMPSAQIYFRDPDGHSLEYITMLDEMPDSTFHGTWTTWRTRYHHMGKTVIGLTGNIATGKSTVMRLAAENGATTIDADKIGHGILQNEQVKQTLRETFGDTIFDENNEVIRPALGRIVFSDPAKLQQLEAITHPAIRDEIGERIANATSEVVIVEAIKLLEGPLKNHANYIWVTVCNPESQVARLIQYRGMSEADARQRVTAQSPQFDKIEQADVVFETNGSMEETVQQFQSEWAALLGESTGNADSKTG
ncbi:MAG: dephospho-CoA kinase [Candidatus Promineifilaceae bacterium]